MPYLQSDLVHRMKDAPVHSVVMLLAGRAEYLGLHARSNDPEGIRNDVAKEATDAGGGSIEAEGLVFPAIPSFETQLRLLI